MTPRVTIHYNSDLDRTYQSIVDGLDARHHAPGNSFAHCHVPDGANLSSWQSASGYEVLPDGIHVRCPDGSIKHIERLTS